MPSGENPRNEGEQGTDDWSGALAYEGNPGTVISDQDVRSEYWNRWHYGVYLATALLIVGAFKGTLLLLVMGYLLAPFTMYFDSRYLESVTTGWQRDAGLYVIGSLLFPILMIPIYLYRRRELRGPK